MMISRRLVIRNLRPPPWLSCLPKRHLKYSIDHFRIQSIGIKQNRIVDKYESFIFRSLFGELDPDYLIYPNLVSSVSESKIVTDQYETIRQNFRDYLPEHLKEIGFWNLGHFTEVEKVSLFEAIGRSLNNKTKRPEDISKTNNLLVLDKQITVTHQFVACYEENKRFIKKILPLIIHNSLVLNTLRFSDNPKILERCNNIQDVKISYAFDEPNEDFITATHPYWKSTATFHADTKTWTLNGTKSRIIDYDCDQFLVFCRIKNPNDSKSTTDCGIASFLVDKNQVKIEKDGTDNHGIKYMKITFKDLVLKQENSQVLVDETSTKILNIRASGQLLVSAIKLGLMKESLHNITQVFKSKAPHYQNLAEHRLAAITERIYGLESMLYLTASHFDSFELGQVDLFLQALAVKIIATEFATETMTDIRLMFDSKRLSSIVSNDINDVLNVLDSFLGSCPWNRMLLATYGLRAIGRWKFDHIVKIKLPRIYYGYFLKTTIGFFRQKLEQRFDGAKNGLRALDKVDGALKDCSNMLKTVLETEYEAAQNILRVYGRECIKHQIDMNRFASIMISPFQMVSVISRTNDDLARIGNDSKLQIDLCRHICQKEQKNADHLKKLIFGVFDTSVEKRSKPVHMSNICYDGYFARPTFDRVI